MPCAGQSIYGILRLEMFQIREQPSAVFPRFRTLQHSAAVARGAFELPLLNSMAHDLGTDPNKATVQCTCTPPTHFLGRCLNTSAPNVCKTTRHPSAIDRKNGHSSSVCRPVFYRAAFLDRRLSVSGRRGCPSKGLLPVNTGFSVQIASGASIFRTADSLTVKFSCAASGPK